MNCLGAITTPLRLPNRNLVPLLQTCQFLKLLPGSRVLQRQARTKSIWTGSFRRSCGSNEGVYQGSSTFGCVRHASNIKKHSTPKSRVTKVGAKEPLSKHSLPIITDFEHLPRSYEDANGLPYRDIPLTKQEAKDIFGTTINLQSAHQLLRRLHGRRIAGTLEDPALLEAGTDHENAARARALEWLREHFPVDEIRNAGLRAEMELSEMDAEVLRDAERIGIYTPNAEDVTQKPGGVYGQGVFEKMRLEAKQKQDELEAEQKSQAEEIRQNTGTLTTSDSNANRQAVAKLQREANNQYWRERALITKSDVIPEMSAFSRLFPSALVFVVTCGLAFTFAKVYEPPTNNADRLWPEIPTSAATVIGMIALNTAIFLVWRVPPCWRFMNKYFLQVPAYPYAFSLLGSVFSHQGLKHLFFNMAILYLAGTRLHEEVGRGNFLAIFLTAGVMGSMASLTARVLTKSFITTSLGASGGIAGIIGCGLLLNSEEKVTIFGFPPKDWPSISNLTLLGILVGFETIALVRGRKRPTEFDHWAHLGGFASGMGSALLMRDQVKMRRARALADKRSTGFMETITNKD